MTSHFNSLNIKKTTTYDVKDAGPAMGQTQKCGGVKPVCYKIVYLALNDNTSLIMGATANTIRYGYSDHRHLLFRCTFQGGIYLVQILDNYVGGWTLLLIGFAECMCISYAYG